MIYRGSNASALKQSRKQADCQSKEKESVKRCTFYEKKSCEYRRQISNEKVGDGLGEGTRKKGFV